ncbi:hypothetical protein [Streptomyces sp. TLI_171]|uniref:hypothetical protein n=1 Tax=Streptomyces sp. TLI_171 TaxID=1938859 RepID=UPI000C178189|nr:hypothetical protein [Streptomyces sp. TLI_171]RKE22838.1 hypothetical protein BX266_6292 [Streptomyces sp. TLI_171]
MESGFGPVRRLRVLAEAGGYPMVAERVLAAPFDRVWPVAADLEGELPLLIGGLRSFRMEAGPGGGDRSGAVAVSALGYRERFEVVLRPGWCLMQSRAVVGGMAAEALADGRVRFALFGGVRLPVVGPITRRLPGRARRRAELLMDRLERRVCGPAGASPLG